MATLEKVVDSILPCFGTGALPLTARVERLEMALGIRPVLSLDLNSRLDNVEARHAMEEGVSIDSKSGLAAADDEENDDTPLRCSEPAMFQTPPLIPHPKGTCATAQIPSFSLFDDNANATRNSII